MYVCMSVLIVTVSHRTFSGQCNLGICPVNFSLCLTKLILAAMYIGNTFESLSEHFQWLTMSTDMYMCTLCVYVHVYVCVYVCMYMCMYVCMCVCTCVCMCVCVYVHVYVCVYLTEAAPHSSVAHTVLRTSGITWAGLAGCGHTAEPPQATPLHLAQWPTVQDTVTAAGEEGGDCLVETAVGGVSARVGHTWVHTLTVEGQVTLVTLTAMSLPDISAHRVTRTLGRGTWLIRTTPTCHVHTCDIKVRY